MESFLKHEDSEGLISAIQQLIAELQDQANRGAKILSINLGAAGVAPMFDIDGKSILDTKYYKHKIKALEHLRLENAIRSYSLSIVGMAEVDVDLNELQSFKNRLDKFIYDERKKVRPHRLTRNDQGKYLWDGNMIDTGTDKYGFQILNYLYDVLGQTDFLTYDEIDRRLVVDGADPIEGEGSRDKKVKRIRNAVRDFGRAKLNGKPLNKGTGLGKPLIQVVERRGLRLNNPTL